MKVLKLLTTGAVQSSGMRSTFVAPKDKMEIHPQFVLLNDEVIIPWHRIVEVLVEQKPKEAPKK